MVYGEIVRQGQLFGLAVLLGAGLLFLYDLLRICRRILRHRTVGIAVEDIIFWLFCALGMFGFMYRYNEGVIRGFLVFGAAVGMILYSIFISRLVVRCGTAVFRRILHVLHRIFGRISRPFRILGASAKKKVGTANHIRKKSVNGWKKRLKKIGKAVKIGLSKL